MSGVRISKRIVDGLEPRETEYTIWDRDLPGFGVRVRKTGAKSYVVVYRAGRGRGAPVRRVTIATVGKITPDQARAEAEKLLANATLGSDPAGEAAQEREVLREERYAPSVAEVLNRFVAEHVNIHLKPKTAYDYRRIVSRILIPHLGDKKARELAPKDVAGMHHALRGTRVQADQADAQEAYTRVKALGAAKGLTWLSPSRVNNTYALAMRRADAAEKGITSISDLAVRIRQGETLRFACNTEFYIRPDGLLPLQRAYRFVFGAADVVRMEPNAIYDALREGTIDVGLVFSTDGRVTAFEFVLLEDDRKFFPSYLLTPVVRQRTLDRHSELADHLNALSAKLDNATMAQLNARVDLHQQRVEDVARTFLKEAGLL